MVNSTFKILSFLGTGHSATVYKAVNEEGKIVALKVYHSNIEKITEKNLEILNERSLIGHNYNHLVKIFKGARTYIKGELRNYLELEYIEGDTLRGLMNDGNQSQKLIKDILPKLQKAIMALKKQGIVYCDLKPENIMITRNGNIKFIDLQHVKMNSQTDITDVEQIAFEKSIHLPWYLKSKMIYQDDLFWKAYNYYYLVELLNDTLVRTNKLKFKTVLLYLKTQFSFLFNFIEAIEEYSFLFIISGYLLANLVKIFKRRKRFQTFFFDDSFYLAH